MVQPWRAERTNEKIPHIKKKCIDNKKCYVPRNSWVNAENQRVTSFTVVTDLITNTINYEIVKKHVDVIVL